MVKPNAKSTLKEMRDYIRSKKLNKPEVKLTMKKSEMVAGLKKIGHWDTKHDGATKKAPAPKKSAPYSLPKGKDPQKHKQDLMSLYREENRKQNTNQDVIKGIEKELKKSVYQTKTKTRVGGTGGGEKKAAPKKSAPKKGDDPERDKKLTAKYLKEFRSGAKDISNYGIGHAGPGLQTHGEPTLDLIEKRKKDDITRGSFGYRAQLTHDAAIQFVKEGQGTREEYDKRQAKIKARVGEKSYRLVKYGNQPTPKKPKPAPTIVGAVLGDKKSMNKALEQLKVPAIKSMMSKIQNASKIDTLANAKKELSKGKVNFIRFLYASNVRSKEINDLLDPINKLYRQDKISEAEYKNIGTPLKRYQGVRRKILNLVQRAFDNRADFVKAEKEAGLDLTDTR